MRRAISKEIEQQSQKHGVILETIGALETVKSLGAESRMQRDWERFVGRAAKTSLGARLVAGTGINFFADSHAAGNCWGNTDWCISDYGRRNDRRWTDSLHHNIG